MISPHICSVSLISFIRSINHLIYHENSVILRSLLSSRPHQAKREEAVEVKEILFTVDNFSGILLPQASLFKVPFLPKCFHRFSELATLQFKNYIFHMFVIY